VAPKSSRFVSIRPDVHVVCVLIARMTSVPAPSRKTLAVLFVMFSISPVPKLRPGPVSYFHTVVSTPVFAAPVKSSLQNSVNPVGGAGMPVGAVALAVLGIASTSVGSDGLVMLALSAHAAAASTTATSTSAWLAVRLMGPPFGKVRSMIWQDSDSLSMSGRRASGRRSSTPSGSCTTLVDTRELGGTVFECNR